MPVILMPANTGVFDLTKTAGHDQQYNNTRILMAKDRDEMLLEIDAQKQEIATLSKKIQHVMQTDLSDGGFSIDGKITIDVNLDDATDDMPDDAVIDVIFSNKAKIRRVEDTYDMLDKLGRTYKMWTTVAQRDPDNALPYFVYELVSQIDALCCDAYENEASAKANV